MGRRPKSQKRRGPRASKNKTYPCPFCGLHFSFLRKHLPQHGTTTGTAHHKRLLKEARANADGVAERRTTRRKRNDKTTDRREETPAQRLAPPSRLRGMTTRSSLPRVQGESAAVGVSSIPSIGQHHDDGEDVSCVQHELVEQCTDDNSNITNTLRQENSNLRQDIAELICENERLCAVIQQLECENGTLKEDSVRARIEKEALKELLMESLYVKGQLVENTAA